MPITVSDLMRLAGPEAIRAANRTYTLGEIHESQNFAGHDVWMHDPATGLSCVISWTRENEIALASERQKIDFVKNLLMYGMNTLDNARQRHGFPPEERARVLWQEGMPVAAGIRTPAAAQQEDPVVDVDFS